MRRLPILALNHKEETKMKVTFKDLSVSLKIGMIAAWLVGVIWILLFFAGMIASFLP